MDAHGWWSQQLLIGWINLVLATSMSHLILNFSLAVYRSQFYNFAVISVGFLLLAWLPVLFKPILAAIIDRWHLGRNNYRNWLIILSLSHAVTLLLLAFNPPEYTSYFLLLTLMSLTVLFATWVDVPVNALAIALLPEPERIRAGAVRSAATSLGSIVGGGLMLVLHARFGWAAPLLALALGMLSCAALVPLLKTQANMQTWPASPPKVGLKQWLGWFSTPQHGLWAVLLVLYYPLIGAIWVYLKPLMLDHGFAPERIALIVGVAGGLVAAIASMAGSRVSRSIGAFKALPLFALCDLLALGALSSVVILDFGTNALVVSVMLVAVMLGASAGLVYGLMMHHTRSGLSALDYGIQSSLFVIGRTFVPMLAGIMLDFGGYGGMLASLMLGLTLVLLTCLACLRAPTRNLA